MRELLKRYRDENGDPVIYITENGCGDFNTKVEQGCVRDEHRINDLHHYLCELEKGIAEGSDVRGNFWTMVDNFEWNSGFSHRMGFCVLIMIPSSEQSRTALIGIGI
jgi:beta-glucosidase/6-phospho-beta-glucosidase/beta-galactosidase